MVPIEMSARIGAFIVHVAERRGADVAALLRATGFDPSLASDPDARMSLATEEALWNTAAQLCDDDDLGLHAAELITPGMFDVLDYVVRTAPTFRAALERLARFNRIEHDVAEFTIVERGPLTRVEHAFRAGAAVQCRHSAEFTLASLVIIGSQMAGAEFRPQVVEFRHAAPRATGEHARVFGGAPKFSCVVNATEWHTRDLAREVPGADPALSRVVERHAEAVLAARPPPTASYVDRVRAQLLGSLAGGDATLASVARRSKMSERSLQRRLSAEGATFDVVLDGVRRELALRYLADPKIAVSEVAYLLGYSEPSPFHRAFRRWTGATPGDYRPRAA